MAFNMTLSWKWSQHVPTFHVSLYFFHLLVNKKHMVAIVTVMFCPVSVLVGWLWQLYILFFRRLKGSKHLTYPLENFFPGGNATEWHSTRLFPGSGPNMSQPSCFPLFLPSSFQQEAFGCDSFLIFCPVSVLVGWLRQLNCYSNGSGHLTYP